ncbi:hypothetical protein T4C_5305, partial [Trichinella pseudospiralis]
LLRNDDCKPVSLEPDNLNRYRIPGLVGLFGHHGHVNDSCDGWCFCAEPSNEPSRWYISFLLKQSIQNEACCVNRKNIDNAKGNMLNVQLQCRNMDIFCIDDRDSSENEELFEADKPYMVFSVPKSAETLHQNINSGMQEHNSELFNLHMNTLSAAIVW